MYSLPGKEIEIHAIQAFSYHSHILSHFTFCDCVPTNELGAHLALTRMTRISVTGVCMLVTNKSSRHSLDKPQMHHAFGELFNMLQLTSTRTARLQLYHFLSKSLCLFKAINSWTLANSRLLNSGLLQSLLCLQWQTVPKNS